MTDPQNEGGPQLNPVSPDVQRQLGRSADSSAPGLSSADRSTGGPFQNPGYSQQDYADGAAGERKQTEETAAKRRKAAKPGKPGYGYPTSIFWFLVGVAVFVVGAVLTVNQVTFAVDSAEATATVVGYHAYRSTGKGGCGGYAYDPEVAFTVAGGGRATATLTNVQICTAPSNGATFHIRYRTADPSDAQIVTGSNWGTPLAVLGVGLLLGLAGFGMIRGTAKARAKAAAGGASAPPASDRVASEPTQESNNQRKKRLRREAAEPAANDPRARELVRRLADEDERTRQERSSDGAQRAEEGGRRTDPRSDGPHR
ncbi:hypothetical protein ACX9R5_06625 [Rathayibacter sp. CAU 1779]